MSDSITKKPSLRPVSIREIEDKIAVIRGMEVIADEFQDGSNFPYVSAPRDGDGNLLNNDGKIALYRYANYFDEKGNFRLSGDDGDVTVNDDGSITINADHKLLIYETEVDGETDYSL